MIDNRSDKEIFHEIMQNYVQLNDFLEAEGASCITLATSKELGLTEHTTLDELVQMAKKRAVDEQLGQCSHYDGVWDDDDDQTCIGDDDDELDDDDL